ncbi:putative Leukotriene A(4) hydrolase protein [Naja naja]|nr:putative Leukotriene A(4) hydrolase protein [Naja naja]
MAEADPSSFAAPDACRTHHLYLSCCVDFESRSLRGTAALTVRSERDNLTSLVLDTKDLTIQKVVVNNQVAQFVLGQQHSFKGAPLEITLPFHLRKGQDVIVEISFETSPRSSALQWFTPEQTSGKRHPFLFSQCQISVPSELVALMSAKRDGDLLDPEDPSRKIFRFIQNVPIPSYLVALVVGALESRVIGPRTLVWAEKELVDKSAYEFGEAEAMLKIAEDLAGPYVWGQYDLLNEGHTVYLERRIGGRLFGEQFRHFQALGGWGELQNTINNLGSTNEVTNLIPSLKEFAYKSIVTEDWKNFLYSYFKDKVNVLNKVDWNAWMHSPGMPPLKPEYDTTLTNACVALSQRWIKATESDLGSFSSADINDMSSHQVTEFLALLMMENPLPVSHVKRMQEIYDFNATNNSEIKFRWLRLCIQAEWEDAISLALKMATEQGRLKFIRPLFKDLYKFEKSRDQTISAFQQHKISMHPVTAMLVSKDLGLEGQTA